MAIDVTLLIARLLFVALLYLFLFAIMKTGIGLVRGQRRREKSWTIAVEKGPKELRGVQIAVHGPVIVGRNPGADIVIGASYVSGRHARFTLMGQNLFIEDLGSTNGTYVNGQRIREAIALRNKDVVTIGDVAIRVRFV
ncbi:FHA domain-containing protein [Cryptobacterium curtum DSM 15641]|uniref:FHA domain-containing protein n=1 Tax=Cryptobacterium curtum (strain ATCC 700683 / DSM 15641 / CCUG 43107 / 12-3) TaxID=469378 RepID=C7MMC0_CRYCD|nr:FHA domain-containing protein [Cryptobacterium curtum]ACU94060.1 FHA domain-containing protein [Cryptobacterium curtum DSM 15641]